MYERKHSVFRVHFCQESPIQWIHRPPDGRNAVNQCSCSTTAKNRRSKANRDSLPRVFDDIGPKGRLKDNADGLENHVAV